MWNVLLHKERAIWQHIGQQGKQGRQVVELVICNVLELIHTSRCPNSTGQLQNHLVASVAAVEVVYIFHHTLTGMLHLLLVHTAWNKNEKHQPFASQ